MSIRPLTNTVTALLLVTGVARAETIDAGPFSVDITPMLTARYNDTVLFSGERCAILRSGGFAKTEPSPVGAIGDGGVIRDGNVLTLIARKGRNVLRREVMVRPDALHLTYELTVFGSTGGTHLRYELLTPSESLEGLRYALTKGLLRRPRTTSDEVFAFQKVEPFKYLFQTGLYLNIKSPNLPCTIDFDPLGPWVGISNYGENWSTSPYHDGETVHFAMFCSGARNGGTFTGKVIVRPGATPYEAIHPNDALAYTTDFPVALALNFTDTDTDERYRMCGPTPSDGQPFGWKDPRNVRIVPRATGGLLRRDFAAPHPATGKNSTDATLELKLRPGLYLLTLNVYDARTDTGPFDLFSADGPLLQNVTIPRGRFWNKTVPLRSRGGRAELRFTGAWKINALTAQKILHEEEDYLFEQPYWNMEVVEKR